LHGYSRLPEGLFDFVFIITSSTTTTNPSSFYKVRHSPPTTNTNAQLQTGLERGGSSLAVAHDPLSLGPEQYELVDYRRIQRRQELEAQEATRAAKRADKVRRLEGDEMKFSHSIQFNAVPDWSSQYIAYSNLKKLYVETLQCVH
jgi:SPX domain